MRLFRAFKTIDLEENTSSNIVFLSQFDSTSISSSSQSILTPTDSINLSEDRFGIFENRTYQSDRNLMAVLQSDTKGTNIANMLNNGENLGPKDLKLFNQIVVADLIKICGYYPTTRSKENLAKAIVSSFRQLGQYVCESQSAHALWFDPKGSKNGDKAAGSIEYRLENERLHLKPEQKKNVKHPKNINPPVILQEAPSDAEQVRFIIPTETNFELIKEIMAKYIMRRKELIASGKSFREIFEEFPQIIAYEGVAIINDFETFIPHKGKIDEFVALVPAINQNSLYMDEFSVEFIKALATVLQKLPNRQLKRSNGQLADNINEWNQQTISNSLKPLIQWTNEQVGMDEFAANNEQTQPIIVCRSSEDTFGNGHFYVLVDRVVIDVGEDAIKAFDVLYKLHHVYNLKYDKTLTKFVNFFDSLIYKLNKVNPSGLVLTFFEKVKNHNIT